MKTETYISIALFAMFFAFIVFAHAIAREVVYFFGCFMFGWSVPSMSKAICTLFVKPTTA